MDERDRDAGMEQGIARAVGRRIRYWRQDRGWSVEQLAEAIGLSPSQMRRLEQGASPMHVVRLAAIARALGVELTALVPGGRDEGTLERVLLRMGFAAEDVQRVTEYATALWVLRRQPRRADAEADEDPPGGADPA